MLPVYLCAAGAPEPGNIAFVAGELWFPAGEGDELVDASAFKIVASGENTGNVGISHASVCAVGYIEATIERDWTISVAVHDRLANVCALTHWIV